MKVEQGSISKAKLAAVLMAVGAIGCTQKAEKKEEAATKAIVSESAGADYTIPLVWAAEVAQDLDAQHTSRYCFFWTNEKVEGKSTILDPKVQLEDTEALVGNPITIDEALKAVEADNDAAKKDAIKARFTSAGKNLIFFAPMGMLFFNHPGLMGVPEILARVAPSMFWYGTGLSYYFSAGDSGLSWAKTRLKGNAQALKSLSEGSLASSDVRTVSDDAVRSIFASLETLSQTNKATPESTCGAWVKK